MKTNCYQSKNRNILRTEAGERTITFWLSNFMDASFNIKTNEKHSTPFCCKCFESHTIYHGI